ncbi:transglutaminase [Streptomyces sp. Tu 2975]|uniref:transglutaminase domain-containing protein n=1 Tax=Streptomyces sp. Tu 2975 TaxID=2676871 RepID=UPI0013591130|nr:transglutaminase domain-containing protein [Streptomyces sp. Tu 2975]QIP84234.1 transglutaminase [Streptomyces sp. Tu 2975]
MGRFRFIPPDAAHYDMGVAAAAALLNTRPENILELVERGMPFRYQPGVGPLFDLADVMNVGNNSRSGRTAPELTAMFLMRFSADPGRGWLDAKKWMVTVSVPDDRPGRYQLSDVDATGAGIASLTPEGVGWVVVGSGTGTLRYQTAVQLTGTFDRVRDARAGDVYQQMLDDLYGGRVTYQVVSEALRLDHHRAWELGMADCMVVSRVIADRLRGHGLAARARRGLLLGPVGSEHAWCEVWEDGRWKAVDVGFAYNPTGRPWMHRPAATDEFAAACFGSRFNRLLPCAAPDAASLILDRLEGRPRAMNSLISATAWNGAA